MIKISITADQPEELTDSLNGMVEILTSWKGEIREPLREMPLETNVHDVYPYPMQTGTGLGEAQEEGKAETEAALRKLIVDLKANSDWLEDSMPIPPDLKDNLTKASKALENMRIMREWILNDIRLKDGHLAEVLKCNSGS